ncbi:MAG: glycosyltransferase, partial [Planctomycetota bacterium]
MRIGVLTSLYPSPERPFFGIFAERKWTGMAARGHEVRVVVPVPWAPRILAPVLSGERALHARVPSRETRSGIPVARPRYLHVPRRAAGNARRFAEAARAAFTGGSDARPDVVVCDYAWPAAAAVAPLAADGLPAVVNGRGSDVLQVRDVPDLRGLLAAGLTDAAAVTAVSQDLLDAMVELGGARTLAALTPNG